MSSPALQMKNEIALNIVSGPDKGISYKLVGEIIKIGRAEDNDVILDDLKASRYHAQIEFRKGEFWIVDSGSQHGLVVNGVQVQEKKLAQGDQIIIGTTTLVYGPGSPLMSQAPSLKSLDLSFDGKVPKNGSKNNYTKYVVIAMVVILGALFFTHSQNAKRKQYKIADDEAVSSEIENISQDNELRQQEIMKKGKDTQQYAEAQAFYLRGARDFREGNYTRAMAAFEAALTLYPEHPLAKRYLARSRLKLNESITASLERGEKYFQNEKYINAFDEYRNVILLINDPNNKNQQLAQKRIEAINLILMNNR